MKIRYAVLATLVSLALAVPALAQETQTVTGTVVSASDASLVIRTQGGEQRTFVVDTTTSLPQEDLEAGARVSVHFTETGDARFQATRVTTDDAARAAADDMSGLGDPDDELPATASPIPLLALGGLIGLVGGAAIRFSSRAS